MATPAELFITYDEVEGRPTIPVSGAYGGPSLDGAIISAHLYTEHGTIPSSETAPVGADGTVELAKSTAKKRSTITRRVHASLVFSPESAEVIGTWLLEKAKAGKKMRETVAATAKSRSKAKRAPGGRRK